MYIFNFYGCILKQMEIQAVSVCHTINYIVKIENLNI